MHAYLAEWLSLIIRWFHVIAGVAWIGASFYFIWLDNHLREPPQWKKDKGIKGDLWAIHGGGIYEVAKYQLAPEKMPGELHWFKWEAYSTFISGMALLFAVYYFGNPGYLIDTSKAALSAGEAIAIGLGTLAMVMLVYETLIRSPLARHGMAFGAVLYGLLVLVAWGLFEVFAGRGAYIHVGAVVGTIMVANVFLGIMPAQRALVDAIEKGQEPGARVAQLAARAKLRSVHNNYMTLPVIFIMISNHYPMLYSHAHGWAILAAIGFITAFARRFFNLRHHGITRPSILVISALLTAILIWLVAPTRDATDGSTGGSVSDDRVLSLLNNHCVACHSTAPAHPAFQAPPAGIVLDQLAALRQHEAKVRQSAVDTHYMPLGNVTGMTDEERGELGQWLSDNR
ncbi:MAG: urate hydroxylase PuuD [Pseudomonas profundi]|uniref:urate hydroxylase PuuD n=1 Tax=Pseudomonas profundi TaxID=1981513 RepID=UPI0030030E1C